MTEVDPTPAELTDYFLFFSAPLFVFFFFVLLPSGSLISASLWLVRSFASQRRSARISARICFVFMFFFVDFRSVHSAHPAGAGAGPLPLAGGGAGGLGVAAGPRW